MYKDIELVAKLQVLDYIIQHTEEAERRTIYLSWVKELREELIREYNQ